VAGSVIFVSERQELEWISRSLSPLLVDIVEQIAEYAAVTWAWVPLCITSIFRTFSENDAAEAKTQIHCYWRAVDIRTHGIDQAAINDVTRWANTRWIYDPARPALPVVYSALHGNGPHMHCQVHAATTLRPSVRPTTEVT
jgi:hypothetical protein